MRQHNEVVRRHLKNSPETVSADYRDGKDFRLRARACRGACFRHGGDSDLRESSPPEEPPLWGRRAVREGGRARTRSNETVAELGGEATRRSNLAESAATAAVALMGVAADQRRGRVLEQPRVLTPREYPSPQQG